MPGVEIGLSQKKKKKDPSANLFLIKYLTCQNYRQLMFLRLSAGPRTAFPTGWGTVGWLRVPVTPALSSLTPREPKPSPDLARFLGGRCLMGQTQNPGPSPHYYGLIPRLRSSQNRRDFVEKWAIFPLDPWKCFRLFSKPGMVVPTFKDCGVRVKVRVRITVVGRVSFNFLSSTPCVGSLMSVLLRLLCAQKIPWGCC